MSERTQSVLHETGLERITYAEPLRVEEYTTKVHPDFERAWERYPMVNQGDGKLARGGKLYSDGFGQCSALVFENSDIQLGGLFHVADLDLQVQHQKVLREFCLQWLETIPLDPAEREQLTGAITDVCYYRLPKTMRRVEIAKRLTELGLGKTKAKLFGGDTGRYYIDSRIRGSLLEHLGIELPPTTVFKDYDRHWGILVDFDAQTAMVNVDHEQRASVYQI